MLSTCWDREPAILPTIAYPPCALSHLPVARSPCHAAAASSFKQLAMLVVARHMQPAEVEGLRQLFESLDEEATGTISMRQLRQAVRHMGKEVRGGS